MKRILITGGAGFIGSNFVRLMLAEHPGLHAVILDKLTYAGNLDNLKGLDEERHTFIRGDIADMDSAREAMRGCDAVANFAADSHVDRSIMGASEFIATNVQGIYNLLEAARELGIARFLHVSTDEVYGSIEVGSFKESDSLAPANPYSASKAGGELIAQAHWRTFGTPVVITRGSNTYGPNQHPEKALPLFISNAMDDIPLPVYGDGRNVRDWLHVEDHCRGIEAALRNGEPGEIYNVAGGNERENIELIRRVLALLDKSEDLIRFVKDRPGHDRRYSIDAAKLRALGWAPKVDWDDGLARTVRWYQENEWWWRKIREGEFKEYYKKQYADR